MGESLEVIKAEPVIQMSAVSTVERWHQLCFHCILWPHCQASWGRVNQSPPLITPLIMGFKVIWMCGHRHPLSRSRVFSPAQWRKLWVTISSELQLGERRHKYKKRVQCGIGCPCHLAHCTQHLPILAISIKLFYYFKLCSHKPLFTLAIDHTYICLNSAPRYNSIVTLSWLSTYLISSPFICQDTTIHWNFLRNPTNWQRHLVEEQ